MSGVETFIICRIFIINHNDMTEDKDIRWAAVKGFPNYEVSDTGLVRNIRFNRILNGSVNIVNGYRQVWLKSGDKSKYKYVHRLVAEAYCQREDADSIVVKHIDGDKLNNNYKNLKYCCYGESI